MSAITKIEWCDRTWNVVRGCALVSEGCRNCYAMKQAHRFSGPGQAYEGLTRIGPNGPTWTGAIRTIEDALDEPLHWRKPQLIFVNSMSDLFHPDVPADFIMRVFDVMERTPQHTYQILTKRPEHMLDVLGGTSGAGLSAPPLPNVWLGVSVENQAALERIDTLKDIPAAIRFVSFEPLLEDLGAVVLDGIHWAIVGGESGPHARPMDLAWARSIVRECERQGVACFVKQLGANWYDSEQLRGVRGSVAVPIEVPFTWVKRNGKGGDMAAWPADLRVREFPNVSVSSL